MGARVVITARDTSKGEETLQLIRGRHPDADIDVMSLDLARFASVRAFAEEFLNRYDALHVLVNNAGVIQNTRSLTEDGNEMTFQVNHLGPFLLTNLLLDRITASAPARIVNVSSVAHRNGKIGLDDLQSERNYRGYDAYAMSKLCNVLFTRELARRLKGRGVTVNALHPGTVRTAWGRSDHAHPILALGWRIASPFFLSPAKGARTSVHLAASPDVEDITGEYWAKRKIVRPAAAATDDQLAHDLWEASARLTGLPGDVQPTLS
jgi:NAD(P)-dependent dehydrogenase (short-subunit alcohol dehydrogenase family)